MARKRRRNVTEPHKITKTLQQWYETLQEEFPDKFEKMEYERQLRKEKYLGCKIDDDPDIVEIHKLIEQDYRRSLDRTHEGPPILHVRFQYAKQVKQSRYEASVFSNIVHEADSVMDKITGDNDDDSDFETMVEVEGGASGLMSGLGIGKERILPELRILVVKVTNANKISTSGDEIKEGQIRITMSHDDKKSFHAKSSKKEPDYKHRIGFQHVFNYRGITMEECDNTEIKISVRTDTDKGKETAYAKLSPHGCELGEVDDFLRDKVETRITFWKEYLDLATEDIVEFTIPLITGAPPSPKRGKSAEKQVDKTKKEEKRKSRKTDLKSLFG
ncbi:uncharacterized protein LOC120332127 [Styela clava]